MRKTNRNTLLAALLGGLALTLWPAREAAAQQNIPPGSYRKTCKDIKVDGLWLRADRTPKDLDADFGAGERFVANADLEEFHECEGDIRNDDSDLKCARNPNHPLLARARAAIDHGALAAFGRKPDDAQDYRHWLSEMFKAGFMPRFYAGLGDAEALDFLSKYLARPEQSNRRAMVIERAFRDVYGFGASPKDVAFYNAKMAAGEANYAFVVFVERGKLKSDQVIRRLMISNAYKKAMGRMPTPGDFGYWQPRGETFREVVEAARAFLHSAQGAKDLAETVARALEAKTGQKPATQEVNAAVVRYAQAKAIYDEMR